VVSPRGGVNYQLDQTPLPIELEAHEDRILKSIDADSNGRISP